MATRAGSLASGTTDALAGAPAEHFTPHLGSATNLGNERVKLYLMSWRDVDAASVTYRTWTVRSTPDPAGAQYTGPKSGATAISNALIACEWTIG